MKKGRMTDSGFTQKQLNDDFCVSEYLRENRLTNNLDGFLRFYDEILIRKKRKADRLQQLNETYTSNQVINKQMQWDNALKSGLLEREQIVRRTAQQLSVSEQLQRTMIQYKKSLVLLKGDIGHIISRNQSEKRLQSKIHKVKIVADDQFIKVNSELGKDINQNRQLNQMQSIFLARLKNAKRIQDSTLGRNKEQFIDLMARQSSMNQKLSNIQQRSLLIKEEVQLSKQKNYNNYVVAYLSKLLESLIGFINSQEATYIIEEPSLPRQRRSIALSSDYVSIMMTSKDAIIEQLNRMQREKCQRGPTIDLKQIVQQIISGYRTIKMNLDSLSIQYADTLNKTKSLRETLNILGMNGMFNEQSHHGFIEQDGVDFTVAIRHRVYDNFKLALIYLNFFHQLLMEDSRSQLTNDLFSFINNEHQIMSDQSNEFFATLIERFSLESEQYRVKFKEAYKSSKLRVGATVGQKGSGAIVINAIVDNEDPVQQQKQDTTDKELSPAQMNIINTFNKYVWKTVTNTEFPKKQTVPAAERIQFLNNIDKDYSHMLKKTLKMEKDHTRKNYEFQRHFQRDKYVNRDAILKQKRFQASFSHLWKTNVNHSRDSHGKQSRKIIDNTSFYSSRHMSSFKESKENLKIKSAIQTPPIRKKPNWNVLDIIRDS